MLANILIIDKRRELPAKYKKSLDVALAHTTEVFLDSSVTDIVTIELSIEIATLKLLNLFKKFIF